MSTAPGWYDDGSGKQRWWDGQAWGPFAPEQTAPQAPTYPAGANGYVPQQQPRKKVSTWLIIAGVVVVLLVIGAIGGAISGGRSNTQTAASSAPTSTPVEEVAAGDIAVPDMAGQSGSEAKAALRALGLAAEFDAGEDTVMVASNWVVNGQSPAAGALVSEGATVTLSVAKKEAPPTEATSGGLTAVYAHSACTAYGEMMFPYGFKGHWLVGLLAQEIQDDQWYIKAEGKVTNEFGAKRDVNIECYVSGSNEAPAVTDFVVY